MEVLVAALAISVAQPAVTPPADNEIVVMGNKLRDWRGSWKMRKGVMTCKTKRSTGDKAIDAIGCDAMVQCFTPIAPRFTALEASKLPKDELNRQANTLLNDAGIGDCLTATREAGIAALVAARRSKRS
ncbi:hypothetical protein [Porphyrobacter sp. AAP60]|uniref:hypothetical protein n=1 Tax=Porphyrobacter sp. AAP60 TaxID=1523423 RepID=UPI0006B9D3F7|nr:hypothetical protein [Porphyrobacter sp. AAP60]KPF63879.1 hypothetical protein IP79_08670 [Porphyrobacter sp. AAP60]